jgi:hypothetical protein
LNLLQVRQNRRERFCITACGDPKGESQDETSDILHAPPNSDKSAFRALLLFLRLDLFRAGFEAAADSTKSSGTILHHRLR